MVDRTQAPASLEGRLHRCAINTATLGFRMPIERTIEAVARAGFGGIGPWRRELEGQSTAAVARHVRDSGLRVTGYCRSTYLPAMDQTARAAAIDDNRRAIDDAATLGAACFVMVVGALPEGSRDLAAARHQVEEGTATLLDHARKAGVRLALEPLHPMYAADRSCLNTIDQALDLAAALEPAPGDLPDLGVVIDAYHVWWDPRLGEALVRGGCDRRLVGFHVSDWLVPTRDLLTDRGMMGDGVIDLLKLRGLIERAGYAGFVEVEIFSDRTWWRRPVDDVLATTADRLQSRC
ncbi:MAG: sugar phosphate isomerase/epimerase family protein [Pseudomonadota bacterium]